jgi:hypothetical protein
MEKLSKKDLNKIKNEVKSELKDAYKKIVEDEVSKQLGDKKTKEEFENIVNSSLVRLFKNLWNRKSIWM